MTRLNDWEIPPRIWTILASWGLAVLVMAALLSWWIQSNEHEQAERAAALRAEQERKAAQVQLEQDQAMCSMIAIFLSGPEPLPGPAGDRSRSVRAGMLRYQATLRCKEIGA